MTSDRPSLALTILVAALLTAAMAPVILVDVPAMLDYVNHLARMELLTGHKPSSGRRYVLYAIAP